MANNKKKENLQSRRDFFKKAAKEVLPVLGAVVLAGTPNLLKAENSAMGCRYGCSGGCSDTCAGSCRGTCRDVCASLCNGCQHSCSGGCKGSCSGSCAYSSKSY